MNNHRCISCGEIIPEGRDICWGCENGYAPDKINEIEEENSNDVGAFRRTKDEVSTES
jgi:predicted  nucleic acid-binding Zn-ribbon protein